jgi:Lar family restriction alleviation protein
MTDDTTSDAVLNCPFCGDESIYCESSVNKHTSRGVIRCLGCGMGTPYVFAKQVCIELWNSRASLPDNAREFYRYKYDAIDKVSKLLEELKND